MAANDALKFAVQIVEDDKKNVESLVKKIQLVLDKDFKLKVNDDGAVKKLEEMLNVLKSVETQMVVISKGLSNSSWGKLGEDLNIAIAEFRNLTKVAEDFGKSMSKSFVGNLTAEIQGTLPELSKLANTLEKVKSESRSADGSGGLVEQIASIRKAEAEYAKLYDLMRKLDSMSQSYGSIGFQTSALERYKEQIRSVAIELNKIAQSPNGQNANGLTANEYAKSIGLSSLTASIKNAVKDFEDANKQMTDMANLAEKIKSSLNQMSVINPMRVPLEVAKQNLDLWQQLVVRNPHDRKDDVLRNQKIEEYKRLLSEASVKESEIQRSIAASTRERERYNKSTNDAIKEIDALGRKIKEVEGLMAKMKILGIDTSGIEKALSSLERLRLDYGLLKLGGGDASAYKGSAEVVKTERDIAEATAKAASEIKKSESALRSKAREAEKLTEDEKKLANAMRATAQSASHQSSVLNDLKSMATQYLSVWGASSFVQTMAQITGELELQQKSLEVIIGSASYASQSFGEIRDLSQQSPYTFQDLLKSTRQLAAFGIETKDLYGTMKALSDIGAGLSVDVQRLILAYGHTKSYGYLSGIQNRQFETAGIDLVGALADRYNKLADAEERAGRAAEHVTRKDVFKMISKKEVGFEDVNAVIMGLDAPGGRFYNMQERQFETLGGKLRNLRNNYNIMMAEMGKDNHGMLMSGVNMLNELTEHWDKYARIITAILIPIGALKLANMALNTSIGLQTSAMSKNVMAMVRSEKAMAAMNAAVVKRGFFSPLAAIGTGWNSQGTFTPGRKDAKSFANVLNKGLSEGSLTKTNLMYMGLSKELPERYRRIALALAGVRGEQVKTMASATGLSRAWIKAKLSAAAFGASLKGLATSLLANPMTWFMAAISAATAVYSHFSSMAEETRRSLDELSEHAKEDAKSIDDVISRYSERGVSRTGGTTYLNGNRIQGQGLSFDTEQIKKLTASDLEELKQELQKFSPFYEGDLVDIGKFNTQAEQIMAIMRKLDSYRHAEQILAATAGNYDDSADGSFWGGYESFKENLEEMGKAVGNAQGAVGKLSEEKIHDFDKELGGVLSKAVESGAAINEAEALRQYIVRTMFMTDSDREQLQKSWSNSLKIAYAEAAKNKYFIQRGQIYKGGFLQEIRYNLANALFPTSEWKYKGHNTAFWNKSAESHIESYRNSVTRLSEDLKKDINSNYGADDIEGALKHAIEVYKTFAAEAKGVSEEAKETGLQMLLQSVFGNGSKQQEAYKEFVNSEFAGEAYKEITESGAVNLWMKPDEIAAKATEVIEKIKERWKGQGKDLTIITQETIDAIVKTIQNDNKLETSWQKKLAGLGGEELWKNFDRFNSKSIRDNKMEADMWDAIRKRYKELQEKLDREKKVMQVKFGIELKPEIFMDSSKILEQMKKLNKNGEFYKDKNGEWQVSRKNTGAAYDEYVERFLPLMNIYSEMYYDQKGAEERNVQLYEEKNRKNGGHGTYKDKEAEVWEQRIKLIQEARREYDYWEKKVGKEAAQDKVKKQFENLVGVDKVLKPGDLDNLENYANVLKDINKEVSERYEKDKNLPKGQKKDTNIANDIKVMRELDNALYNIDKSEFERKSEEFVSQLSFGLDELTRKWEIFNNVREKTGDVELASQLAGFSAVPEVPFRADSIRQEIVSRMQKTVPGVGRVDFAKVLGLDEHGIEEEVKGMFRKVTEGLEEGSEEMQGYERMIEAIIKALKDWKKAQQDLDKEKSNAISSLLNGRQDYASVTRRINESADRQKQFIKGAPDEGAMSAQIDAKRNNEIWKASVQYANLMNNAMSLAQAEIADGINKAMEDLNRLWQNNLINATDYASEMEKLHKMQREYEQDGVVFGNGEFGAFARGGLNGAVGWLDQRIAGLQAQKAEQQSRGDWYESIKTQEQIDKYVGRREKWEKQQTGLLGVANVSQLVMGAFDGLQGAAQSLSDMFDALGNQKMADKFSDIADGISGVSSIFSPVGDVVQNVMSGDIGGVLSSAIQAPIKMFTGPIEAFSRLHDKKRDREIEKIGKELTKIGNSIDLIKSMREQELGYAKGVNMRAMAAYYRGRDGNKANQAMAEYYSRATEGGAETSYAMEYNLILEQRTKKMQQYNEEADKKKKDDAKLEEYKKEIAELDAQVQQFAENLMNELWGIDFKGWASQISDALMTAFENGTSAAEAFDDVASDIMRSMAKNMLNLAIVEPFMDAVKKKVLGYTDENGEYHAGIVDTRNPEEFLNNAKENAAKIATATAAGLKDIAEPATTASMEFLTGFEDIMKQFGWTLKDKDKSSGSNSISQTITEETAGYMTGILAAMHQDGSVRRLQLQMLVGEQMPNVIEMMTVSGGHIAGIDESTRAIMRMMQEGSGEMFKRVDNISSRLDRFASGFDKVSVV